MNNWFKIIKNDRFLESLKSKKDDPFSVKEGRFHFGELKDSFYYTDWTEGSFLADTKHRETVSFSFDFRQLKYFILLMVIGLIVLVSRAFWLQVNKNDYYSSLSEDNRLRSEIIEAKRGIIYSSNMQALVRNKANFVLYFKPIDLPSDELLRDNLLREISQILSKEPKKVDTTPDAATLISITSDSSIFYQLKDILSKIQMGSLESYQPLFVADNIDYEQAMRIDLELANWPGVFLSNKIKREYLSPGATSNSAVLGESSFSHILGYTGKINSEELKTLGNSYSPVDYIGKMGIEYSWEKELKGIPGKKNIEVDALGRQKQISSLIPAVDGDNLLLSLDAGLQEQVEKITQVYLSKAKLHRAAVVVMNPNNGEILALLSLPFYDNNLFARGINHDEYNKFLNDPNHPLFNRAINGEFPSGSTIKPIFAAGALQDKIITETTSVLSTGGLQIGQWFFPDWKAGGHGLTDVKKALAFSVNTFFYYIGGGYNDFKGLGVDGLAKYAQLFGLGKVSGIDLPGERSGFVPTADWKKETKKESWYIGDTYHFAIGQGDVLVTPLQVANYISAIANGGTLYKPHLVSKILNSNNQIIKNIDPVIIRSNIVDENNLQIIRAGMRQTITIGSGISLNSLPVQVAGKTGTAQWSSTQAPHAWFVGFAPYNNPQIVITVLVEEGVEGSAITAQISKDILNWYFTVDHPVGVDISK